MSQALKKLQQKLWHYQVKGFTNVKSYQTLTLTAMASRASENLSLAEKASPENL